MAYFATIRFTGANVTRDCLIRIEAGSILHAALSAEMICKGYYIGTKRVAEVLDIKNYQRVPANALETNLDFTSLSNELNFGEK